MEPAEYAAVLVKRHEQGAIGYLVSQIEQALRDGDDANALYLDSVLQHIEAMTDYQSARSA